MQEGVHPKNAQGRIFPSQVASGLAACSLLSLAEGKEPPIISEIGESVTLTFMTRELSPAFRLFVAEENRASRDLGVDYLLVMQYLLKHREIETTVAATLCQRFETQMREQLSAMERVGYLEHGGTGRGAYWTLRPELHQRLAEGGHAERDRRIDWEAAKTRVLSILVDRARRGEQGLSNREIRQITRYDRQQVKRLMSQLASEESVRVLGRGRGARWEACP